MGVTTEVGVEVGHARGGRIGSATVLIAGSYAGSHQRVNYGISLLTDLKSTGSEIVIVDGFISEAIGGVSLTWPEILRLSATRVESCV